MPKGAFSEKARAAIYEVGGGRCIGCGSNSPLTAQHRDARGMGGSRTAVMGSPANGVPLCGSGVSGCHGWTEANPVEAELLGWRIVDRGDPVGVPFWTRFGWQAWAVEADFYFTRYVDPETDLDRVHDRADAITAYGRHLAPMGLRP